MDLLRHLRFFVTVAEERHFGQAAASLGMTQPPLSQGVQRLERHLGVRLFDRDARGVRITEAGAALLPRAEEMLAAARVLVEAADSWTESTTIRLGIALDLETRAPRLAGAVSEALASSGVLVRPTVAGSADLVDAVRDSALDLAVVRHPAVVDGTRPRDVLTLPTRLVVTGGTTSGPVRLRTLDLPLVVPARRHHPAAHDQLVDALRREGHSGTVVEEDELLAREALVAAGTAARLVPAADRGRPIVGEPVPVRVRVTLPVPALRLPGLDHDAIAELIEDHLGAPLPSSRGTTGVHQEG